MSFEFWVISTTTVGLWVLGFGLSVQLRYDYEFWVLGYRYNYGTTM